MGSVLAIDIGGTTVRGVEADATGLNGEPWEYSTETFDSAAGLAERLQGRYEEIDAIGVAAAGVVDRETGEIVENANWAGWDLDPLAETFDAPVVLENDADASALGLLEYRDLETGTSLAYITISTGIGGGVVADDRLVPGVEAGFIDLNWDGSVTHADTENPWEGYASGACFPDRVSEWLADEHRETVLTGEEDIREFFEVVYTGDRVAREYYTRLKRINAAGIGTLTDLFSLDLVVIGGGVALNHPRLVQYGDDPYTVQPVELDEYTVQPTPAVELTTFGDDLELYGAAAAALRKGVV